MRYLVICLLAVSGCATKTVVQIPQIPEPPIPVWTKLTEKTPCIEYTESGKCMAWRLSRSAYAELVRRDAEMQAYIKGLMGLIRAHNEAAR